MRFFIIFSLFVSLLHVSADTASDLRNKVDSMNAEIKALETEIASYSTQISKTQGEAKTLKGAVQKLEDQKKLLEKKVEYTKLQVNKTRQDISETEDSIDDTTKNIEKQKKGISELLLRIKQDESSFSNILSLLDFKKVYLTHFFFTQQSMTLSEELQKKSIELEKAKTNLETAKGIYEQKNNDLKSLQKTLVGEKDLVIVTAKEKNDLLIATKNKEAEYQKIVADKKEKKLALEKESADFEAKLKVIIDTTKIPKFGTGALSYPVQKITITQTFGNTPFATANSQVYSGKGHNGIDFGVPVGSKILAAQSGIILGTGNTDAACPGASYGKWILIRHPNGLSSLYAHLSSFLVKGGDTVSKGDTIALSGNTGYSTGPHLHFTVYASDAVHITGPTEYRSKACGTYLIMPVSPTGGYLNPLSFF